MKIESTKLTRLAGGIVAVAPALALLERLKTARGHIRLVEAQSGALRGRVRHLEEAPK